LLLRATLEAAEIFCAPNLSSVSVSSGGPLDSPLSRPMPIVADAPQPHTSNVPHFTEFGAAQ